MEKLIAKNQESALLHIESNYGKFTTDWYPQLGRIKERQIGDDLIVKLYSGECQCGETIHFSIEKSADYKIIADYTVCESCYNEGGGDDDGSNGIIYPL